MASLKNPRRNSKISNKTPKFPSDPAIAHSDHCTIATGEDISEQSLEVIDLEPGSPEVVSPPDAGSASAPTSWTATPCRSKRVAKSQDEIESVLRHKDLSRLQREYDISEMEIVIPVSRDRVNQPPEEGYFGVYEHQLRFGLKFPLSRFVQAVLSRLGVSLAQILPNSIAVLVAFEVLCAELGFKDVSATVFFYFFTVSKHGDGGWLYFHTQDSRSIFKGLPSSIQGWKDRFFYVRPSSLTLFDTTWRDKISSKELKKFPLSEEDEEVIHGILGRIEKEKLVIWDILRPFLPEAYREEIISQARTLGAGGRKEVRLSSPKGKEKKRTASSQQGKSPRPKSMTLGSKKRSRLSSSTDHFESSRRVIDDHGSSANPQETPKEPSSGARMDVDGGERSAQAQPQPVITTFFKRTRVEGPTRSDNPQAMVSDLPSSGNRRRVSYVSPSPVTEGRGSHGLPLHLLGSLGFDQPLKELVAVTRMVHEQARRSVEEAHVKMLASLAANEEEAIKAKETEIDDLMKKWEERLHDEIEKAVHQHKSEIRANQVELSRRGDEVSRLKKQLQEAEERCLKVERDLVHWRDKAEVLEGEREYMAEEKKAAFQKAESVEKKYLERTNDYLRLIKEHKKEKESRIVAERWAKDSDSKSKQLMNQAEELRDRNLKVRERLANAGNRAVERYRNSEAFAKEMDRNFRRGFLLASDTSVARGKGPIEHDGKIPLRDPDSSPNAEASGIRANEPSLDFNSDISDDELPGVRFRTTRSPKLENCRGRAVP